MSAPLPVATGGSMPLALVSDEKRDVEAQTTTADGRYWSYFPVASKKTIIVSAVGIASLGLTAGWIFGAVWWGQNDPAHGDPDKEHRVKVGKIVFGTCFGASMLGLAGLAKIKISC